MVKTSCEGRRIGVADGYNISSHQPDLIEDSNLSALSWCSMPFSWSLCQIFCKITGISEACLATRSSSTGIAAKSSVNTSIRFKSAYSNCRSDFHEGFIVDTVLEAMLINDGIEIALIFEVIFLLCRSVIPSFVFTTSQFRQAHKPNMGP